MKTVTFRVQMWFSPCIKKRRQKSWFNLVSAVILDKVNMQFCLVTANPRKVAALCPIFSYFYFNTTQWNMPLWNTTPQLKAAIFFLGDCKDGTSTIAILLQSCLWPSLPERCYSHPQALVEPVYPVEFIVLYILLYRLCVVKKLVCPPPLPSSLQPFWDWLYLLHQRLKNSSCIWAYFARKSLGELGE
jgi:hypothetical protein